MGHCWLLMDLLAAYKRLRKSDGDPLLKQILVLVGVFHHELVVSISVRHHSLQGSVRLIVVLSEVGGLDSVSSSESSP